MISKILVIFALSFYLVAGSQQQFGARFRGFNFGQLAQRFGGFGGNGGDNNGGGEAAEQQQQEQPQQEQPQQEQPQQEQEQEQGQQEQGGGRVQRILGNVANGLNLGGQFAGNFGDRGARVGGWLQNAGGIVQQFGGFFGRATADEEGAAALSEEEQANADAIDNAFLAAELEFNALAEEDPDTAQALVDELSAAIAEEQASLDEVAFAMEDEAALAVAMDPTASATTPTATTTASASTPSWAVALIVIGSLVAIALIVVQIQLVMLFRKRLPAADRA
jgi:hypothetical protein